MMKDLIIALLCVSTFGMIIRYRIDIELRLDKAYESGYKEAKLIYECDHDRAECEIIKDTL